MKYVIEILNKRNEVTALLYTTPSGMTIEAEPTPFGYSFCRQYSNRAQAIKTAEKHCTGKKRWTLNMNKVH